MARILIVDGSEPISRILALLLEGAGHTDCLEDSERDLSR